MCVCLNITGINIERIYILILVKGRAGLYRINTSVLGGCFVDAVTIVAATAQRRAFSFSHFLPHVFLPLHRML